MYGQDDMNMQKAYIQMNEMFGKQHLKQLGYKLAAPFSDIATAHLRDIKYANTWISDMKQDAAHEGEDFNNLDPEWASAWMYEVFDFDPTDYGVVYKPGSNQSDYIRKALAAKANADRKSKLKAKKIQKEPTSKPTPAEAASSKAESPTAEQMMKSYSGPSFDDIEEEYAIDFDDEVGDKIAAANAQSADSSDSIDDELRVIQKRKAELEELKKKQKS